MQFEPVVILAHLFEYASPSLIIKQMTNMCRMVLASAENQIKIGEAEPIRNGSVLLANFGMALTKALQSNDLEMSHQKQQSFLNVFNQAWKVVATITHTDDYMACVKVYVPLATLYFGYENLNVMLGEVMRQLTALKQLSNKLSSHHSVDDEMSKSGDEKIGPLQSPSKSKEKQQDVLMHIINMATFGEKEELWSSSDALAQCNNILSLFEYLHKPNQASLAKQLLEKICGFTEQHSLSKSGPSSDKSKNTTFAEPLGVQALIYMCSILSDSIDALTIQGDIFYIMNEPFQFYIFTFYNTNIYSLPFFSQMILDRFPT